MEVYKEEINDLLDPKINDLKVSEPILEGFDTKIEGLTSVRLRSIGEFWVFMRYDFWNEGLMYWYRSIYGSMVEV